MFVSTYGAPMPITVEWDGSVNPRGMLCVDVSVGFVVDGYLVLFSFAYFFYFSLPFPFQWWINKIWDYKTITHPPIWCRVVDTTKQNACVLESDQFFWFGDKVRKVLETPHGNCKDAWNFTFHWRSVILFFSSRLPTQQFALTLTHSSFFLSPH